MKVTKYQLTDQTIKLVPAVISGWRKVIIQLAKKPRDLPAKELDDSQLVRLIAHQERGNMRQLWEAFTTERKNLPRYLLDPKKQTVSYPLGFHLPNMARTKLALWRVQKRYDLLDYFRQVRGQIRFFDLGCGTGAVAQQFVQFVGSANLPDNNVAVDLIDETGAFLDAARAGLAAMDLACSVKSQRIRLEKVLPFLDKEPLGDKDDLIAFGLGYVWNELAPNPKARQSLLRLLSRYAGDDWDALIVLLEPSNQNIARDAMALRNELSGMGFAALYPCPSPHSQPCPMLEKPRDWCFSEVSWARPSDMVRIDKLLEIDRSKLRSAAYIFASPSLAAKLAVKQRPDKVVVGRPDLMKKSDNPKVKTGFDYLVCGAEGLSHQKPAKERGLILRGEDAADKGK